MLQQSCIIVDYVRDAVGLRIVSKWGQLVVGDRMTMQCTFKNSLDKFDPSECSTFELHQILANGRMISIQSFRTFASPVCSLCKFQMVSNIYCILINSHNYSYGVSFISISIWSSRGKCDPRMVDWPYYTKILQRRLEIWKGKYYVGTYLVQAWEILNRNEFIILGLNA